MLSQTWLSMPVFPISDPRDPRLDVFRHLKISNATRRGLFVAEGQKLVELLVNSDLRVHSLVVDGKH